MEFRWCAAIALWTILSGPIFHGNSNARPRQAESNAHRQADEQTRTPYRVAGSSDTRLRAW